MSKGRKGPFTSYEKEYLKELVGSYAHILESKKTDVDFQRKKDAIWEKIAKTYNSSPNCEKATATQLKKLWLNLKARARDALSIQKQRMYTGGGPSVKEMSPEHDTVLSLVPNIMPSIKVSQDSNGFADPDAEDDDLAWVNKRACVYLPDPPTGFADPDSEDNDLASVNKRARVELPDPPTGDHDYTKPKENKIKKGKPKKNLGTSSGIEDIRKNILMQAHEHHKEAHEIEVNFQKKKTRYN